MSYEILRPLGRGGMGEVYLASDSRLGRQVALKTLRADLAGTTLETQLREEARLLAQLNHPHIVQIYDITEHEGKLALVMEYVEGQTLHVARREGRGDYGELLRWLAEIAEALDSAHSAGIAHRDLKAENVLLTRDGVAKVTDFGIAAASTGRRDLAEDLLALGNLAATLLRDMPAVSPTVTHLIEQLQSRSARTRPDAGTAAQAFRAAWHESSQDETLPPVTAASPPRTRALLASTAALALAAAGLLWFWLGANSDRPWIAVLPPQISSDSSLSEAQLAGLHTTVAQGLQQAALGDGDIVLISAAEAAAVSGTPRVAAAALGAQEVVAPTLRCASGSCELLLERIDPDGAVLSQRAISLPANVESASFELVQAQWPQLYPDHARIDRPTSHISDAAYAEYLRLHRLASSDMAHTDTLPRIESLIDEQGEFLPLYRLHADVALDLYDLSADRAYLERARRVLDAAPVWASDTLALHRVRYDIALEIDDFESADRALQAMQQLGAGTGSLERLRGKRYSYAGEFARADAHFQRAIAIRPTRSLLYSTSVNYYQWGRFAQAREHVLTSLDLYPGDSSSLNVLGLSELQLGRLEAAVAAFESALALVPDPLYVVNLGLARLLQGQYSEARDLFRAAMEQEGTTPINVINLADAEGLLGNRETAQALYRDVIRNAVEDDAFKDMRALSQAYAQLGQHRQAIATLQQMGKNRHGNAEAHFNAALVYTLARQDIAAMVEIEQALAAEHSPVWFTLPWFDPLCAGTAFADLMAQRGYPQRCQATPGQLRLN